MASGSGQSGVAVGDGKRKRSKVRNRGVRGSGSGNGQEYPGDPPTLTGRRAGATEDLGFLGVIDVPKETPLLGVRTRVIVEIKCWAGKGRDFNYDVKMVKGWETLTYAEQKLVAAIVHDFARSYWKRWNPEHSAKRLNIRHVELLIRKQDLADELLIGGGLMDKHVRENPLVWMDVAAGSDEFKALKKNIAEQALPFLKTLKAAIAEEHSRAGRQRQDEAQILPFVEGFEPLEYSEIQRLKDQITSLKDVITSLKDQIISLKVTHAVELEAKDAELMAKDNRIASLEATQRTVEDGCLIPRYLPLSPTTGFI